MVKIIVKWAFLGIVPEKNRDFSCLRLSLVVILGLVCQYEIVTEYIYALNWSTNTLKIFLSKIKFGSNWESIATSYQAHLVSSFNFKTYFVTEFWKINHFVTHEIIEILKFNMVLPWAENGFWLFYKFFI